MQPTSRQSDRQAALLVSIAVGVVVAIVTTATFYWIVELSGGPERREAARAANAPWDPGFGTRNITEAGPNVPDVPPEGRSAWLGTDAWELGVQTGQAWVQDFPNTLNVQVLQGMTSAQVWAYMTQHVSPALGVSCQYCHVINGPNDYNFAAEDYPQKQWARSMLRLVADVNAQYIVDLPNWKGNYVRCATCHQGVPQVAEPEQRTATQRRDAALGLSSFQSSFMDPTGRRYFQSVAPIGANPNWLDSDGMPTTDPAVVPEELQGRLPLRNAILAYFYNYEVWLPFDAEVAETGRGSLALTYPDGPTQDQVNISQGAMNFQSWSLGVGCTYCHNSRNFIAYELGVASNIADTQYGYNKLKAQRMMQLTTWLYDNWTQYGAQPKPEITFEGTAGFVDGLYYRKIDNQAYSVPGCYTCHAGKTIPLAAINQAQIPEGEGGITVLPQVLRGQNQSQ
jgi:photosynthetic reaction center cytochrome c subunit